MMRPSKTLLAMAGALVLTGVVGAAMTASAHGPRGGAGGPFGLGERMSEEDIAAARESMFNRMDADGDGAVTLEETTAFIEAERARRIADRFAKADTDGNGAIDAEEFATRFEERMKDRWHGRHDRHDGERKRPGRD